MLTTSDNYNLSLIKKIFICLTVAILIVALRDIRIIKDFEMRLYDFQIKSLATGEKASEDIIIIGIDDRSLSLLESEIGRWPWPRYVYEGIVDYCSNAKAIAFDIILSEEDRINKGSDLLFAESAKKNGNVISALYLSNEITALDIYPQKLSRFALANTFTGQNQFLDYSSCLAPYPDLLEATKQIGHINQELDDDDVLRSYTVASRYQKMAFPSLALAAAIEYFASDPRTMQIDNNGILTLGDKKLVLENNCKLRILPANNFHKTFSIIDILASWHNDLNDKTPAISRNEFDGKIVLVGSLATGLQKDREVTAGAGSLDGIRITGIALDNMINGKQLKMLPDSYHILLIFILCFLPLFQNLTRPRTMVITIISLCFIYYALSITCLFFMKMIFPLTTPTLSLLGTSVCLGIAYWYLEMSHRKKLEFSLQEAYDNLKNSNKKLEDYSRTLESKVEERTCELREKNVTLEKSLKQIKDMQNKLIMQEKLASLGQVTTGIAHEIKNPLNFVNNFANLSAALTDDLVEIFEDNIDKLNPKISEEIKEILCDLKTNSEKINEHGSKADIIVQGMLLHHGKNDKFVETDIHTLIDENINVVHQSRIANGSTFNIDIKKEYDPTILSCSVIPHVIARVFINILNNAFYAVEQRMNDDNNFSPEIIISSKKKNDEIYIIIRDNGNGIPVENQDKIFNPFFTTKPTGTGTGLGLSVCYEIITKVHKGTISIKSENHTFAEITISLPLD